MAYIEELDYNRAPNDEDYLKPKYPVWIEALKVFLIFLAPCSLVTYAAYDSMGAAAMAYTIPLYILPWVSVWVRRSVFNVFVYLLVHIVFGAWFILPLSLVVRALGIFYVILVTVYGMVRRFSKQAENEASFVVLLSSMGLLFVLALFMIMQGTMDYTTVLVFQAGGYAVLFLFYQHRLGIHDALRGMEGDSNFSTRRVTSFNTKMLWAYLGIMVAGFGLLYLFGLGNILTSLGTGFMRLVRFLVHYLSDTEPDPAEELDAMQQDVEDSPGLAPVDAEPWKIWIILQNLLEIVFAIIAVVAIVLAIYYIIRAFTQRRPEWKLQYQEDTYEETKVFYRGEHDKRKKRRRLSELFDNSPENRIRRAYYRRVKGQIDHKVKRSDTPNEVAGKLTDVKELAQQYNEVRYGEKS